MKRGFFLKLLGIGAGAAAGLNAEKMPEVDMVPPGAHSKFEPTSKTVELDGVQIAGFQDDNLYPNSHEYDHHGIRNDLSPYNGYWRQCICIKSSPLDIHCIGDVTHINKNVIMPIYWVELKGQGILISAFKKLDKAVYCGDTYNSRSHSFYHSDDPAGKVVNTNGKYLILPDARGIPF